MVHTTRADKCSWKNIDKFIGSTLGMSVLSQLRKRCFTSHSKGIEGSTLYPDWVFGSIGQNVLSPVLVGPILRLKCMHAQCISNTTRVCLKAMEKHFFLLTA